MTEVLLCTRLQLIIKGQEVVVEVAQAELVELVGEVVLIQQHKV